MRKRIIVVDDFYTNPEDVEEYARSLEYIEDIRYYKGFRSKEKYLPSGLKQKFENCINENISEKNWQDGFNGCFQITTSLDSQVYHYDSQRWVGILYLSKGAPIQSGTRTHISKDGARDSSSCSSNTFSSGYYDSTQFNIVDSIGNIYNRLIIMDGTLIHSAGPYWGNSLETGRLVQLFFFNME